MLLIFQGSRITSQMLDIEGDMITILAPNIAIESFNECEGVWIDDEKEIQITGTVMSVKQLQETKVLQMQIKTYSDKSLFEEKIKKQFDEKRFLEKRKSLRIICNKENCEKMNLRNDIKFVYKSIINKAFMLDVSYRGASVFIPKNSTYSINTDAYIVIRVKDKDVIVKAKIKRIQEKGTDIILGCEIENKKEIEAQIARFLKEYEKNKNIIP